MKKYNKLTIDDLDVAGKRVLCRVDFNVPMKDGKVDNDKRIKAAIPTIKKLTEMGGRVILMSHLGRPKGQREPSMSLEAAAKTLGTLIGTEVAFVDDCIGEKAESAAASLKDGQVLMLENLRFYAEEEKNDPDFAAKLAKLGDLYVNDAFGTAHRAHASTEGVTKHFSQCAIGYLMKKELDYLGGALAEPKRPFVAIMGGAKVSDKIAVIEHLIPEVDHLLIGGGMTFTFLKAMGKEIGKSLLEEDRVELAGELLKKGGEKIVLPVDFKVTDTFDFAGRKIGELEDAGMDSIPADKLALDIGPESIKKFSQIISKAGTVVWNGPMGVFEIEATAVGTFSVARSLVDCSSMGGVTVVGGGDSASAVSRAGLADKVSHVSTGGGASLEFLEGRELPGVAALTDR